LLDVAVSLPGERNRFRGETFMVFECCDHDLGGIAATVAAARAARARRGGGSAGASGGAAPAAASSASAAGAGAGAGDHFELSPRVIRSYMAQLLSALAHMHARGWVHRDLKPTNVLVTRGNELKVADFGLSRDLGLGRRQFSTFLVVTQWYRAPELIFADPAAGTAVDVWAAGCILAELMTGEPLFTPDDNIAHSRAIYRLCGVPDAANWPGLRACGNWSLMAPKQNYAPMFKQRFKE
jgi:hypothetical protein